MGQIPLHTCDWMRELASVAYDGELSELDEARLRAHLAGCSGCRAYAAGVERSALLMHETPLEQMTVPIILPARRLAVARKLQVAAAAAAVAATVGLSVVVGSVNSPSPTRSESSGAVAVSSKQLRFPDQELRMLQRVSQARSHPRLAL